MARKKRTCNDCENALFQQIGYSNWTTEGTIFLCMKRAHPEDGFDRFYNADERLAFGAKCAQFKKGVPIDLDVERERLIDLSEEQKALLAEYEGHS